MEPESSKQDRIRITDTWNDKFTESGCLIRSWYWALWNHSSLYLLSFPFFTAVRINLPHRKSIDKFWDKTWAGWSPRHLFYSHYKSAKITYVNILQSRRGKRDKCFIAFCHMWGYEWMVINFVISNLYIICREGLEILRL